MKIEVSIPQQTLRLLDDAGALVREYRCSTFKIGPGTEAESHRTPTGRFRIVKKLGHGEEAGTIFKSRQPVGLWQGEPAADDYVLTRILWLDGLDEANANTCDRDSIIHGTNQEHLIGTPASQGCVRLTNADVIDLFSQVEEGTGVVISL